MPDVRTLNRRDGTLNHLSIAYLLSNIFYKKLLQSNNCWNYRWWLGGILFWDTVCTDIVWNQLIQFCFNNATNLHHLTSYSTPRCPQHRNRKVTAQISVTLLYPMHTDGGLSSGICASVVNSSLELFASQNLQRPSQVGLRLERWDPQFHLHSDLTTCPASTSVADDVLEILELRRRT